MAQFVERIEKAAVFRSLENLMTFPFVRKAVVRGASEYTKRLVMPFLPARIRLVPR